MTDGPAGSAPDTNGRAIPRVGQEVEVLTTRLAVVITLVLALVTPAVARAQTLTPAVAFGRSHALALTANGEVLSWGANLYCQLGRGGPSATPRPVLRNAVAIAAADEHSLALTADGTVYGWGMNATGLLGTGNTQDVCQGPVAIASLAGKRIAHIATGKDFSVAVSAAGEIYCAGANDVGQCPAARTDPTVFAPLSVPGLGGDVKAVAAGFFHTLVLTGDGRLHAFGRGREGQLGSGALVNTRTLKTSVAVPDLTDVVAIAAGIWHSAAVRADGSVWLWGSNHEAQLCDATRTTRTTPAALTLGAGVRVTGVAAGGHGTLLRTSEGALLGCGDNLEGAFGGNHPLRLPQPTPIAAGTRAWPIAISQRNGAISTDGCSVRLAGENASGIVRPGQEGSRLPFAVHSSLSLCGPASAAPRPTEVTVAPRGGQSGCWAPSLVESPASPAFAPLNRAMLATVEILKTNVALLAPPEPARMRAHLSASADAAEGTRLHVAVVPERKADGTRLWTAGCGVSSHLERIGGQILQVDVSFNQSLIGPSGTPPTRTGQLGPYPEYDGVVVVTRDGRLPWVPETLSDQLDREAARRREALAEWKRDGASAAARTTMLEDAVQEVERYRASFTREQLRAPAVVSDTADADRRRLEVELASLRTLPAADQQQIDGLARERRALEGEARTAAKSDPEDAARLRARAADLARQARAIQEAHMELASIRIVAAMNRYDLEKLRPGTADRALRVKADPTFPDAAGPGRIQVILLRVSQSPDPQQAARRAWQQQVKATLDVTALAALLQ